MKNQKQTDAAERAAERIADEYGYGEHWVAKIVREEIKPLTDELDRLEDLTEDAWGIIANAYGSDWGLASKASGWKAAAERWRDRYHATLPSSRAGAEDD